MNRDREESWGQEDESEVPAKDGTRGDLGVSGQGKDDAAAGEPGAEQMRGPAGSQSYASTSTEVSDPTAYDENDEPGGKSLANFDAPGRSGVFGAGATEGHNSGVRAPLPGGASPEGTLNTLNNPDEAHPNKPG